MGTLGFSHKWQHFGKEGGGGGNHPTSVGKEKQWNIKKLTGKPSHFILLNCHHEVWNFSLRSQRVSLGWGMRWDVGWMWQRVRQRVPPHLPSCLLFLRNSFLYWSCLSPQPPLNYPNFFHKMSLHAYKVFYLLIQVVTFYLIFFCFSINFYFRCMGVLPMYVSVQHVIGALERQKRTQGHLALELQIRMSRHMGVGNGNQFLCQASQSS